MKICQEMILKNKKSPQINLIEKVIYVKIKIYEITVEKKAKI